MACITKAGSAGSYISSGLALFRASALAQQAVLSVFPMECSRPVTASRVFADRQIQHLNQPYGRKVEELAPAVVTFRSTFSVPVSTMIEVGFSDADSEPESQRRRPAATMFSLRRVGGTTLEDLYRERAAVVVGRRR